MDQDDLIVDREAGLDRLLAIMARLRDPVSGCPWDQEQTYDTIVPYTIEEAYEVADAVERRRWDELRLELGDLLLQVVYFAQIAREDGHFDFHDVARGVANKMFDRHPHVFGEGPDGRTADDQARSWEDAKAGERAAKGNRRTLDGIALGLPALMRAAKLQKRLARVGFDWPDADGVMDKVVEEVAELNAARRISAAATEVEFGDLLFTLVNVARLWGIDAEAALRRTNAKVERRFAAVEDALAKNGRRPRDAERDEMDAHWNAAKDMPPETPER